MFYSLAQNNLVGYECIRTCHELQVRPMYWIFDQNPLHSIFKKNLRTSTMWWCLISISPYLLIAKANFYSAGNNMRLMLWDTTCKIRQHVDLPPPVGPTSITPNRTHRVSYSCSTLATKSSGFWRPLASSTPRTALSRSLFSCHNNTTP